MRKHIHDFLVPGILAMMIISVPVRAQWVDGGTPVCSAQYDQRFCCMTHGPMGSAYIAWADYRQGFEWDIYIQRMARSGHPVWEADGIAVCTADGKQDAPIIVADGNGGAIVIWQDERTGSHGIDLYAQRFDLDGNPLWETDGVLVTGALGDQIAYHLVADGSGGVIVPYEYDSGTDIDIYMQRLRWTGDPAWDPSGIPAAAGADDQAIADLMTDGCGGAFLSFFSMPSSGDGPDHVQRIDSLGNLLWGDPGVPVRIESGYGGNATMTSDGKGGIFLFWSDWREILNNYDIYAQRIDQDGTVLWIENGVSICSMDGHQMWPRGIPDGAGGSIVVFHHSQFLDFTNIDIYAQRIDSLGTKLWGEDCVAVCTAPNKQGRGIGVTDDDGGVIISWTDSRYSSNPDPYIQRLSSDGTPLWTANGIRMCSALGPQYVLGSIPDGEGGAIVSWDDKRSGYFDIYAQRIDGSGGIVATTLAHMVSSVDAGGIRLEWILSEELPDAAFVISRKDGSENTWRLLENAVVSRGNSGYIFEDNTVEPGGVYLYRIKIEEEDGQRLLFETGELNVPSILAALYQNHPNPFNPVTTIRFELPERARAIVTIYDVAGREISVIADRIMNAGMNTITWDGHDTTGNSVESGVYFYRLRVGKETLTRKMILLR